MVLPMTLVRKFHQELSFYSCTVSNFEQYTLARFIKDGYFEMNLNIVEFLIDDLKVFPYVSINLFKIKHSMLYY